MLLCRSVFQPGGIFCPCVAVELCLFLRFLATFFTVIIASMLQFFLLFLACFAC